MLILAFIAFAILVVAWLVAPNGEVEAAPKAAPVPAPGLGLGEGVPA